MRSHRPATAGALGLLLLVALLACGNEGVTGADGKKDEAATPRTTAFAEARLTWAQDSTIHYGDQDLQVPGNVEQLWRTPYVFLAQVRRGKGINGPRNTVMVDTKGATTIKGSPDDVHVSPDGRYAGWIDYDGPKQSNGKIAEVVVVDLRSGRTVFENHDQMGGPKDDLGDLYEDAEVHFLGFDDDHVYWDTPVGDVQRRRARIGEWKPQDAEKPAPTGSEGEFTPIGLPYDSLVGRTTGMLDNGRESPEGYGIGGLVSPDGRWCLTDGTNGHLTAVDCRSGAKATPTYPAKWVFFGGWKDADTFYVQARQHYAFVVDLSARDRSTAVLGTCSLVTRRCQPLQKVVRADSVVFADGRSLI